MTVAVLTWLKDSSVPLQVHDVLFDDCIAPLRSQILKFSLQPSQLVEVVALRSAVEFVDCIVYVEIEKK